MLESVKVVKRVKVGIESQKKQKSILAKLKRDKWLYIFLIPVILYFFLFKYVPIFFSFNMAFRDFNLTDGMLASKWVGFDNFTSLFSSGSFYNVLKNTIVLNILLLLFSFPFPIILALLLNEVQAPLYKKSVQSILYIPHFISWVVLGGIIISFLSPSSGFLNHLLKLVGQQPIYFMASEEWWLVTYVVSDIWQSAGWGTIIYMAAITGIDPSLYEATIVDGAGKWKQTLHITLPGISSTIVIMLIMRMGAMLNTPFEQIYALQNDAVLRVSDVIATYEYRIGLQGMQYSFTTALGLFKGVVGLVFISAANKIANAISENGLW